jgi:hypothetical protein
MNALFEQLEFDDSEIWNTLQMKNYELWNWRILANPEPGFGKTISA